MDQGCGEGTPADLGNAYDARTCVNADRDEMLLGGVPDELAHEFGDNGRAVGSLAGRFGRHGAVADQGDTVDRRAVSFRGRSGGREPQTEFRLFDAVLRFHKFSCRFN